MDRIIEHVGIDLLADRVKEAARHPARKVEAAKLYRGGTSADLAEAKAAVEGYLAAQARR